MQNVKLTTVALVLVLSSVAGEAAEYYVAPEGNDNAAGSRADPLGTIQAAADRMKAGDTCYVRGGTYKETVRLKDVSGDSGKPVRFVAAPGERVVLDGTEPIRAEWSVYKDGIYRAKVRQSFEQLFVDREMMVEARWPNMPLARRFDRSCWAATEKDSDYGKIICQALAETGVDWTGALATLNIAHQFWSWTRTVEKCDKGSNILVYSRNMPEIERFAGKPYAWADDYFYLSGKLEALDAPTEWFHDETTGELYLYAPDGKSPAEHNVHYKKRAYAFEIDECRYVELRGFHFFGATFRLDGVNHCLVEDCRLLYPSYSRRITEFDPAKKPSPSTQISGNHNTVRKVGLAYATNAGILMNGGDNTLEDCIIHDVNWVGTLSYPAVKLSPGSGASGGGANVIRRNTLYNAGNAILSFNGENSVVEYNHVYDGGLLCKDVSLVYTQLPTTAGSVIRYNWIHGCKTDSHTGHGGLGGLGIRGDDQTRRLTAHHNVVWDCGRDGIIIKGDHNGAYNNTVFAIGAEGKLGNYVNLPMTPEPVKPWRKQWDLLEVQNANSQIFNNAARTVTGNNNGTPYPPGDHCSHNYQEPGLGLVDVENFDFRPAKGSPLIDAGRVIPGVTDNYQGKAPDVGAYEFDGEPWKPGAGWLWQ